MQLRGIMLYSGLWELKIYSFCILQFTLKCIVTVAIVMHFILSASWNCSNSFVVEYWKNSIQNSVFLMFKLEIRKVVSVASTFDILSLSKQ
jgi:hypothetical protein